MFSTASASLGDPRVAGGIALSTSVATLIALAPDRFGLRSDCTTGCAGEEKTAGK
ncbi:MAG TPA: hypothetical protein VEL28_14565 [Candidatus Binatia bacterium]|nr:hypothetical protein [Candidatus Binatia bacterium]